MKIVFYNIMVYEGVMDAIHGGGSLVNEACVPDLNLVLNGQAAFIDPENERMKPRSGEDIAGHTAGAIYHEEHELNPEDAAILTRLANAIKEKDAVMDEAGIIFDKFLADK